MYRLYEEESEQKRRSQDLEELRDLQDLQDAQRTQDAQELEDFPAPDFSELDAIEEENGGFADSLDELERYL